MVHSKHTSRRTHIEDIYFSRLAEERYQAVLDGAKLLSHEEVWGEVSIPSAQGDQ